jgi:heavy metal efflux system protein
MRFLSWIVEFSLKNRPVVWLLLVSFLIVGFHSFQNFKMDAVPDVTNVQVQIITYAPALSPLEIEQYISYPVEKSMSGLPGLDEIRSISRYGLSLVTVVFTDETDIYKARQLVGERIKEAAEAIPPGYGMPYMGPISSALGEVYQFTLESDRHSLMELTTYLNWEIAPRLKTVKGIIEVNPFGGHTKQYQIKLNLSRTQALGIPLSNIWTAFQKNNSSMGGGYIEKQGEHYLISASGMLRSIQEMEQIEVGRTSDGFPIKLSEIATIELGSRLRLGATTMDGKGETVGAIAMMLIHENALEVCKNTENKIEEIRKELPQGMKINSFYDRSVMVRSTIKTVLMNLLEGAILVILILFLFLGSIRSGLVIALVIPLAMIFAIILMNLRGESGNLMSLGAIDFGLIVDGAVIIIENSTRRLGMKLKEKGGTLTDSEKMATILEATLEVRKATIFGELIIAIVYFPILTLSGIEGKMFKPMALTVLYALFGAFIFSLTIVPVLAYHFLEIPKEEHETKFFHYIKKLYIPLLEWIFVRTRTVFIGLGIVMLLTLGMFYRLGGEFMPDLDEGSLLIEIGRLPSTSLSQSLEIATQVEKSVLKKFSEITRIVSRTGTPDIATDPMGVERTDSYLLMKPRKDWTMSRSELIHELEELMELNFPQVAYSVSQPIQMRTNELLAGIRSDVGIKIFGEDIEELKKISSEISGILSNTKGVKDIRIEQLQGLNYFIINPKRENLARYGLSVQEIQDMIQTFAVGLPLGFVLEGRKRFEIVIVSSEKPFSPEEISRILIPVNAKISIPLGDVAEVLYGTGPAILSHENTYRRTLVEFNVRGRDMLRVVEEVDQKIKQKLKFPIGYRIEFDGKYKNYVSARDTLLIVIPATLVLIFVILWFAFKEISPTILILLNVPFSISGGVFFLFIRGLPFSISAGVGFVALFGVAILNGLVLITFAKDLESKGLTSSEAIFQAALLRFRPVLTTALVAAIGFIPMAISQQVGSEVQRPLATVVIGGILSSSLLTLLILPTIYSWYFKKIKNMVA